MKKEIDAKKEAICKGLEKDFPGTFEICEGELGLAIRILKEGRRLNLKDLSNLMTQASQYDRLIKLEKLHEEFFPTPKPVMRGE